MQGIPGAVKQGAFITAVKDLRQGGDLSFSFTNYVPIS